MRKKIFEPLWLGLFMLSCSVFSAQSSPNLEFATVSGVQNPQGNGPVYNASINFVKNVNNPSGVAYTSYLPNLKVDLALSNQQYNSAVMMGYNINNTSISVYPKMNYIGTPANSDFTSSGASVGQGISIVNNNGVSLFYNTAALGNKSTSGTYAMADLTITFNRPVDNPTLHIGAMGAFRDQLGIAGGFELVGSNVPVTLTRLSGNNNNFSVAGTSIGNVSLHPNDVGTQSASGSVLVSGNGITQLKFRMSVRGDGGELTWGNGSGDLVTFGISLLESDLSITNSISNNTPQVDDIVTFTIKAKNNGASNNTGVIVSSLVPDGYQVISASSTAGSYNSSTGAWNIDILNDGIEEELYIQAKVKSTGSYTLNSTISGDLRDPFMGNNTTSLTPAVSARAVCYNDPNISIPGTDSKFGITTLQRAGQHMGNWPMVRKSGHLVLESNTKGFVITRVSTGKISDITIPVEGMILYDTTEKCLKIYSDNQWSCFSTAACP
ncbi:DUF11 domain-containing protein [Chryseobacterium camelliae]|uniref:DUF11 domain-containing protein n=1 Tax=Chryseobacterium camelliae TaxID=1265445 RepID=A0ABY7QR75_9FLAO|nr:DUF11 domain-containing protein [Chryseobacterium camelliae]WBV61241.1 DUF11 domain-containing protein [Chryseobacterium camelliae]